MTPRRHRLGARGALAAGALCLAAAGCSSSATPVPKHLAIYEATVSARTARVWVYLNVHAPRASTNILAEGQANLSSGTYALGVQAAGVTTHVLRTGEHLYFQVPQGARAMGEKPWAEVVLSAQAWDGADAASAPALTDVAPVPLIDVLAAQPEGSVFVGKSRVAGRLDDEYRFNFPTAALVAPALGPGAATSGSVISLIAGLPHPREAILPVYVWLDTQGRAVQLVTSATLDTEPPKPSALQAALANQLPATISVRLDLRNLGEPFKFEPPPAAEVSRVPISELQAGVL